MPDRPRLAHYAVEPVADGVYAGIARDDGLAICNSGWVDLGDGVAVFDTGMTPVSAAELRSVCARSVARPVALVVNSHFHLDHTLGNQAFAGIPIWATRRTREIMLESAPSLDADLARADLEVQLAGLELRRGAARSEGVQSDLDFNIRILRAALEASGRVSVRVPDVTFETRLALPGPRGAELASFGSGHTAADAILHLAGPGVLFAGDLVTVGVQPSMGSADPHHWLEVLDCLEELAPEFLIPGHGPVANSDAIVTTRDYLAAVLYAAGEPRVRTVPEPLRRWEGSVTLEENLAATRRFLSAAATGT